MPVETISRNPETSTKPEYSSKSFELVFSKFCSKYSEKLSPFTRRTKKDGSDDRFMGLHPDASVQEMAHRLAEVGQGMGDAPEWEGDYEDDMDMREALLFSARHLAWYATMGGVTRQYVEHLDEYISKSKHKGFINGGSHQNMNRLYHDRQVGVSILLGQNHALRDYFDSGLARTLGNDSPRGMNQLLEHAPFESETSARNLAAGISLEIATKRYIEQLLDNDNYSEMQVAYGTDEQDSRAGDIVIINGDEVMFIDVKSSMPEKFSDGSIAQPEDYERGYKWLDSEDEELKIVVWAYSNQPIKPTSFSLADERFAQNLELVVSSMQT